MAQDNPCDYGQLERELTEGLALRRRPVAIRFSEDVPDSAPAFGGRVPAGCSFWRIAGEGEAFRTTGPDHHHCAIGSYTHNLPLPEERAHELEDTLQMMFDAGYLEPREVPEIPRLPTTPESIVYAPLGDTPERPDLVLLVARPGQAMLLGEAALRAGVAGGLSIVARPTCMALPMALNEGLAASTGCVGNRVYTEIGDDELYLVIRSDLLAEIAEALTVVASANRALADHHQGQRQAFASNG